MAFILFATMDPQELDTLRFVAGFFADRGHRTEVVTDGHEALQRIEEDPPDILVTDVLLKHGDGFELIRELKLRDPERQRGTILLGMVSAEVGSMLPMLEQFHAPTDLMIIKPYYEDRKRLAPYRPLNYHEQLIVSVAQLLYRTGMEPRDPST